MAEDDNPKKITGKNGSPKEMQYEIDAADITTFNVLSEGPKFFVYRGVYKNKRVAVKVSLGSALVDDEKELFLREVEILRRVNHRNIAKFIGATVKNESWMMIVFELVENSYDVQQYLKSDVLPELETVVSIALLTSKAMEYLHSQGIFHGNICSKNVLIASDAVKLTGFSEATEWLVDGKRTKRLRKKDVFAFADVLIDILEGFKVRCLLDEYDGKEDRMPKALLDLLEACISKNPEDRPEFTVIRQKLESFASSINHVGELDLGFDLIKGIHIPVVKKRSISLDPTFVVPGASIHHQDRAETSARTRGKALPKSKEQMVSPTLEAYMLELKPDVLKCKTAIIKLALRISEAMQKLHAQGFSHRNLNSSRVFLTEKTAQFLYLGGHKVSVMRPDDKIEPEQFKTDVYKFSRILWELLTNNHSPFQAYASSKKEKRPILKDVPDELLELMISCGSEKAKERPDFTHITATLTTLLRKRTPQAIFRRKMTTLKIKN